MLLALFLVGLVYGQSTTGVNIGRGPNYDASFWRWSSPTNKGVGLQWMDQVENILGLGAGLGTGHIYYVDSNVSVAGDGSNWANAKETLDEAVGLCTADNGDIILIAQGHSEAMGTGADVVDVDVAGVTIIGLGSGKLRPLFDYTDYDSGSFAVGADDVTLYNLTFCANVTDVNEAIEVEAGAEQVTIANCLFFCNAEGTDEFHECIKQSGAAADRLSVLNCEFDMGGGGAQCAIAFIDSDYAHIDGNTFFGDYAVADVNNATTASNHVVVSDNLIFNGTIGGNTGLNAKPGIALLATTTGLIVDNYIGCNLATKAAAIVAADCYLFENYYNEDESSAGTGGIIGTASADDGG
jgi:hypothetical protein